MPGKGKRKLLPRCHHLTHLVKHRIVADAAQLNKTVRTGQRHKYLVAVADVGFTLGDVVEPGDVDDIRLVAFSLMDRRDSNRARLPERVGVASDTFRQQRVRALRAR